ncbi:metal ABC transporter permease [bacterium]|nr:metal ABC transporter permease [bacterium]
MSGAQVEIQFIAILTAVACALPGVFLVLRKMAMMSDAVSHAILFGIVVAYFIVKDISNPFLILGAALAGLLTVLLVELLYKTRLLKEDAAIGLVFPLLFSLGVIMVSRFASHVHLDTDAVLLGELAFAPFDRLTIAGVDIGPKTMWVIAGILLLNVAFLTSFYKELKLVTFDAGLAGALGLAPAAIHYSLMGLVSLTAVGSFDAVGAVLVVALMIVPPATAYLLTDRLFHMLLLAAGFGALSAVTGYWGAVWMDANIAGSMATMTGVWFAVVFALAPDRGLLAQARRRKRQRWEFARRMLIVHILQHENEADSSTECSVGHMQDHLHWGKDFADRVLRGAKKQNLVEVRNDCLFLTERGRISAEKAMVE